MPGTPERHGRRSVWREQALASFGVEAGSRTEEAGPGPGKNRPAPARPSRGCGTRRSTSFDNDPYPTSTGSLVATLFRLRRERVERSLLATPGCIGRSEAPAGAKPGQVVFRGRGLRVSIHSKDLRGLLSAFLYFENQRFACQERHFRSAAPPCTGSRWPTRKPYDLGALVEADPVLQALLALLENRTGNGRGVRAISLLALSRISKETWLVPRNATNIGRSSPSNWEELSRISAKR